MNFKIKFNNIHSIKNLVEIERTLIATHMTTLLLFTSTSLHSFSRLVNHVMQAHTRFFGHTRQDTIVCIILAWSFDMETWPTPNNHTGPAPSLFLLHPQTVLLSSPMPQIPFPSEPHRRASLTISHCLSPASYSRFAGYHRKRGSMAVTTAECILVLPQDIVAAILTCVPVVDMSFLFRCSVVCKQWAGATSSPTRTSSTASR